MAIHYIRADATGGANNGRNWNDAYTFWPTLVRGDTYYVADGSYPAFTCNITGSAYITIKKATQSDHGTDTGWNSSYGDGQAVIAGLSFSQGYCEFDGQVGGGYGSWRSGFGFLVRVNNADNRLGLVYFPQKTSGVRLRHMGIYFQDALDKGLTGSWNIDTSPDENPGPRADLIYGNYGGSNLLIDHCWLPNAPRCSLLTGGGWNGITIEHSCLDRCRLQSLTKENKTMHAEIWSARNTNNVTVRYCYITDWVSSGGLIGGWTDGWYIYGNIFEWRIDRGATSNVGVIGSWNSDDTYYARNYYIYNNTFVNVTGKYSSGQYSGASSIMPSPNSISNINTRNNLFYNCPGVKISGSHSNNWFQTIAGAPSSYAATIAADANAQQASGSPFTDLAAKDFTLAAPTNTGSTLVEPYNLDMRGIVRGQNGTWDRGAFEKYSGESPPPGVQTIGAIGIPSVEAFGVVVIKAGNIVPGGITYVGVGAADWEENIDTVPGLPAGLQVGDLLLCYASFRTSTGYLEIPTGWTQIFQVQHPSGKNRLALFYRAVVGGETPPIVRPVNGAGPGDVVMAQCCAFRGVNTSEPVDVIGTLSDNVAQQNIGPISGITPTANGALVLVLGHKADNWESVDTL